MIVTDCAAGSERLTADAARDALIGERHTKSRENMSSASYSRSGSSRAIEQLHVVAGLCNAGEFDAATQHLPLSERKIHGDATDQAILRFAASLGHIADLRRSWTTKFNLAFNSKNKFMIRVLGLAQNSGLDAAVPADTAAIWEPGDLLLTIKGAPEVLLGRCTRYIGSNGASMPLDNKAIQQFNTIKDEWSSQGRRVLLLAHKAISRSSLKSDPASAAFEREMLDTARTGLTLVGLVAIVDPPRPEIPEVVRTLRAAGIRIFMVTGDFALTAQAIAAECGIITNPSSRVANASALTRDSPLLSSNTSSDEKGNSTQPKDVDDMADEQPTSIVLTGSDLLGLNDLQWDQLANNYTEVVFSRTTPEQKLRIVRELHSRGHVVGMTGCSTTTSRRWSSTVCLPVASPSSGPS
jgi:sodium/potassium-transporting ATPase subunit alpha